MIDFLRDERSRQTESRNEMMAAACSQIKHCSIYNGTMNDLEETIERSKWNTRWQIASDCRLAKIEDCSLSFSVLSLHDCVWVVVVVLVLWTRVPAEAHHCLESFSRLHYTKMW